MTEGVLAMDSRAELTQLKDWLAECVRRGASLDDAKEIFAIYVRIHLTDTSSKC
jgi:hypothetical protein